VTPRDTKYGRITVEREPDNPFGDGEPVFLLRARDVTSGAVLDEYKRQSETYGAPAEHLAAIDGVRLAFARWQDANAALVKVPD
jgi:hypothetical protein